MTSRAPAGSQTAQLGVGPVDQGAAFPNQVLAVVEQGAQIRCGSTTTSAQPRSRCIWPATTT
jgi:hypothetical protein